MIFLNFKIRNEVPLQIPADTCCNCSSTSGLEPQVTKLKHMPYMGLGSSEVTMPIPFPYCASCKKTSGRYRPHPFGILAVTVLIAVALIIAWFFGAGPLVDKLPIELVAGGLFILSLGAVLGFYALRKPAGSQTSYYQPIRLVKVSQKWPADITGMVLSFSNHQYRDKFEAANQEVISKGILKVSAA